MLPTKAKMTALVCSGRSRENVVYGMPKLSCHQASWLAMSTPTSHADGPEHHRREDELPDDRVVILDALGLHSGSFLGVRGCGGRAGRCVARCRRRRRLRARVSESRSACSKVRDFTVKTKRTTELSTSIRLTKTCRTITFMNELRRAATIERASSASWNCRAQWLRERMP